MATNVQKDISSAHFSSTKPVLKATQLDAAGSIGTTPYANAQNINTLEVYLLTQGYTQAKLNQMTKNDKIYAQRQAVGATLAP